MGKNNVSSQNRSIAIWWRVEAGPIDGRIDIQHCWRGWSHIVKKHLSNPHEPWDRFADRKHIEDIRKKFAANAPCSELQPLLQAVLSGMEHEFREAFKAPRYIRSRRGKGAPDRQWLVVTDASMVMVIRRYRYGEPIPQLVTTYFKLDEPSKGRALDDIIRTYAKRYSIKLRLPSGNSQWVAPEPDEQVLVKEGRDEGTSEEICHQDVCFMSLANWGFRKMDGEWVFSPQPTKRGTPLLAGMSEDLRRRICDE